ncbi:MAG: 2-oxoglutarate oxidoreductase subunit KorB [Alphaproteobacteria bacterium MarineAlpha2_Bin1]|nr:MAG: 2-oxoglutarate oxidoreductase subunit KorB [Alphaproteobacteria bacterium MarineAlpha2_Bin1]
MNVQPEKLKANDFASDQEVRWCPGCGDYAILKALQRTMPDLGVKKEDTVFVSGIGCAARFPYYMSTFGFHTIHGRAPAFATGIKIANPNLDVWVVGGDGDMLSIGGNHLIHVLRRNVNLQLLIFNNEIYGLTKGQYSPTSRIGTRSPSTPSGSLESPISAIQLALGAGARFVARSLDTDQKHLPMVFSRAHKHKGTSLVEIFQNCIVYNDGVFDGFTGKDVSAEKQIKLEDGMPLIYGKERNKGLMLRENSLELISVELGKKYTESDLLVHNEKDRTLANLLASMESPDLPVAVGVIYCDPVDTYDELILDQEKKANKEKPNLKIDDIINSGYTWKV